MRALVVLGLLFVSARAQAVETVRTALLVGNNTGSAIRRPLRYAEGDAHKLGEVLGELGGFQPDNVHVVTGRSLREVVATLAQIKTRVDGWRASGRRVVMLFYFSGHSDGQALELGEDRWDYADLRARLKALETDIRIAIVDSCQSGALLAHKGGTPGPGFDIRFTNDLATSGEAVLTSSAADELALESRDIRASFFSHYLISGLRGAADSSGDGRVTLSEAYRHAFVNTLLATSGTLSGPQHPGYDYRMSGRGELVLTEFGDRGATLTLPEGFEQILVVDDQQRLVAELTRRSANRIALPPGSYLLRSRQGGRGYELRLSLARHEARTVARAEFAPAASGMVAAKGDLAELGHREASPTVVVMAEGGLLRGAADDVPWLGGLRLSVRSPGPRGFAAGVEVATGAATGFRENTARGLAGGFLGAGRGRFHGEIGWRLVGGAITQRLETGGGFTTWLAGTGPWLGGAVSLSSRIKLSLSVGLDGLILRRDGRDMALLSPNASAGLAVGF